MAEPRDDFADIRDTLLALKNYGVYEPGELEHIYIEDVESLLERLQSLEAALRQARTDFGMVAADGSTAGYAIKRIDVALTSTPASPTTAKDGL